MQSHFTASKGFITELLFREFMAQKKKKEPEVKEEYTFVPPDFDEKEFLEKDLKVTKTVLISALLAVVFGVVAYATTSITFVLGLLLIVAGAVALKKIFEFLPWDISSVENKTWLGNGAMFFFLALGVWVLLLNPPFSDSVEPQIGDLEVWNGNYMYTRPYNNVTLGAEITFNATVTDNGGLSSITFSFTSPDLGDWPMVKADDGRYQLSYTFDSTGTYNFTIIAVDDSGNSKSIPGSVTVVAV